MNHVATITNDQTAVAECEYALLATLLFDSKRVDRVADIVKPEDFSVPFFGRIYGLVVNGHARGEPVSILTLRPLIEVDPAYEPHGGTAFLAKLAPLTAGVLDAAQLGRQVVSFARRRRFREGIQEANEAAADPTFPIEQAVDIADAAITEAVGKQQSIAQISAADAMRARLKDAGKPKRSIKCGRVPSIDGLLGGMRPKQLVIGAGRPGMGKTAAALSYSLGAARNGHGVLFVSLEMSADELVGRMAADISFNGRGGVPYADINGDEPSIHAVRAMDNAANILDEMPFEIVDAGSLTIGRLDMIVRSYKRRFAAKGHSLDLVVVDYLQLLRSDDRKASAYEAVSEISRRLKGMAKDHDVAVFALAQLSRAVEQRPDKRPVLSDLRESGQIEQDADAVLFFYRHAYYLRQALPASEHDPMYATVMAEVEACQNTIEFIARKVRNGTDGSRIGEFYGAYQAVRG